MKNCINCGAEILPNTNLCSECGFRVSQSKSEVVSSAPDIPDRLPSKVGIWVLGVITAIVFALVSYVEFTMLSSASDDSYSIPIISLFLLAAMFAPIFILEGLINYAINRKKGKKLLFCIKKAFFYILFFSTWMSAFLYSGSFLRSTRDEWEFVYERNLEFLYNIKMYLPLIFLIFALIVIFRKQSNYNAVEKRARKENSLGEGALLFAISIMIVTFILRLQV